MSNRELKQRGWVKKHRKNLPQIHKEVSRRILVLQRKLWHGDPKPFAWLLLGMLDRGSPTAALGNAMLACWELGSPKVCLANYLNLLSVASTLSYFNRQAKGAPKVLAYAPLNAVPAEHMHLLDFTPAELGHQLDAALKAHGNAEEFKFISSWLKGVSYQPAHNPVRPSHAYKAESRKNSVLSEIRAWREKGLITGQAVISFHVAVRQWFTAKTEAAEETLALQFKQARKRALPKAQLYDAERLKSLTAGFAVPWAKGGNILANNLQKWVQGDSSAVTLNALEGLFPPEPPAGPAKGTPDEICLLTLKNIFRREHVQEIYRRHNRSVAAALPDCRLEYPDLTFEELQRDCELEGEHLAPALAQSSAALHRGTAYAEKQYKCGRANAVINMIWGEYLNRLPSF